MIRKYGEGLNIQMYKLKWLTCTMRIWVIGVSQHFAFHAAWTNSVLFCEIDDGKLYVWSHACFRTSLKGCPSHLCMMS